MDDDTFDSDQPDAYPSLKEAIARAEDGEPTTFTRNGRPVAILMSHDAFATLRGAAEGLLRLKALADHLGPSSTS